MKQQLKSFLRHMAIQLGMPLTRNIRYDIHTGKIFRRLLKPESNGVDVGAHKGEILDELLKLSPQGKHFAFEPIPDMFRSLQERYGKVVSVFPYALSSEAGTTTFNIVLDDPAYSGLKERTYKTANPKIEKINVDVRRLDDVLHDRKVKIDLIKIDVEGGELGVLKGARNLIHSDRPAIIFECGRGASEFYGTGPAEVFQFFSSVNYNIYTLSSFLHQHDPLSRAEFIKNFETGEEYYFIAIAA